MSKHSGQSPTRLDSWLLETLADELDPNDSRRPVYVVLAGDAEEQARQLAEIEAGHRCKAYVSPAGMNWRGPDEWDDSPVIIIDR